ncbi:low molecular weight phosphatase family protein [Rhodococcus antarcticus]|uniref:Low molecular weight phosphatase family protein n=1 Tax=Rhodococcus antarcticus TaxID=2987751 RepID=A0ABY6P084_9NOCA|nr:low molecular weight phosphatase family protein [Rhodococcus antarcticus]UZJ24948.1 low molecular weight phosphatase family protein [Rhodococcus antarcticus]
MSGPTNGPPPVRRGVLYVCTANLCRSPLAEHVARAQLAGHGVTGLPVSSAGVSATAGTPVEAEAAAALRARGLDPSAFRSRVLGPELVRGAALVLTASRRHREAVLEADPTALRRTFTVRELARYVAAVDLDALPPGTAPERLDALAAAAGALRGTLRAATPRDDDVSDPFHRGPAAMAACAAQLEQASAGWTAAVAPRESPASIWTLPPSA